MIEDEIARMGRRDIVAAAGRRLKAGSFVKAVVILAWLPLPLRWSRARMLYVRKKSERK